MHEIDYVPCYRSPAGTGTANGFYWWDDAIVGRHRVADCTVARGWQGSLTRRVRAQRACLCRCARRVPLRTRCRTNPPYKEHVMKQRHQVIIVGGGPVGVALAVELGQRGISCALVERRLTPQRIPKGQGLTQRSMEHLYFWGVADKVRAVRLLPPEFPTSGITAYKNLMSEYWYAPPLRELVNRYYFQEQERLPQYLTEECCARAWRSCPTSRPPSAGRRRPSSRTTDGVRVAIAEEGGAGRATLEADYVVGCDGGHSLVREQIGIERGGTDFDQLMVLAVLRSRELHEGFKRFPPRSTFRAMHPDLKGYWMFFGRVDVGEGFFFHAPVPPNTTRDNYDFHGLLQRAAGFDFECEFDYVGFWDLRIAVAEKYQVGRVFIAGDAAHSHPPYGGYGLNNGLDDVANLGWKLAARLKGWGSDALLASYSEERRPVFQETATRVHRGAHRGRPRHPRALRPGARPRRVRARLEPMPDSGRRRAS